jgi:5'-nucleotidase
LKSVLEEQWQPAGSSRPFLKLGLSDTVEYTYDPAAAAGDHIDAVYVDGEPVDAAATYRVTVNSFLASGGDNFATLAQGTNRADTGKIDLQSMVDYFEANPVAAPDYAQRAVGAQLTAPADAAGYAPGESVTLALSSLLFSAGEPNAGTAVVSADGVELGSAPIDPAIVDTTDEVGRASVAVTIPADAATGTLVLTVTVPETGTQIDVPIAVVAPEEPAEKLPTSTSGSANKLIVFGNSPVTYSVAVRADGVVPTGEVVVYDGLRPLTTITLDEADGGRDTVTLPRLGRGLHLLTARYQGNDELLGSFGWPSLVIVF